MIAPTAGLGTITNPALFNVRTQPAGRASVSHIVKRAVFASGSKRIADKLNNSAIPV